MDLSKKLNDRQQFAAETLDGPVLILAGAGSGKTRTLTYRVANLIEHGVDPYHILAITFTNKAADEMRSRIQSIASGETAGVWVATFHSTCARILRTYSEYLDYSSNYSIYDADDQKTLVKNICKKLNIDTKFLSEKAIIRRISDCKDNLVSAEAFEKRDHFEFRDKQIAKVYVEYEKELKANNAMDFDDLILKTVELFKKYPPVLENYQDRFQYICVDEYQDTNNAQFEFINLLASKYQNLCVVGDDDQSIYKFRGANIRNILDFERSFPNATVVKLEENYRSTKNILGAANSVISKNINRKDKTLWTKKEEGHKVRFRQLDNAREEADFVYEDIRRDLRNRDIVLNDTAILYRTNAQSREFEERFIAGNMPYKIYGGINFYSRKEIKDVLAYLRTIDNAIDDIQVRRVLNVPRRGVGDTSIQRVAEYAADNNISFMQALRQADLVQKIGRSLKGIQEFVSVIDTVSGKWQADEYEDLSDMIDDLLIISGYYDELQSLDPDEAEERMGNVSEFISKAAIYTQSYREEHGTEDNPTLSEFLTEVSLVADLEEADPNLDCVKLMTIHAAKGLEFKHVYVVGMENGIFPNCLPMDEQDEEELEEERRLAYVAYTRAEEELTLTAAKCRFLRGEMNYNPVSKFVMEIEPTYIEGNIPRRTSAFGDSYSDVNPYLSRPVERKPLVGFGNLSAAQAQAQAKAKPKAVLYNAETKPYSKSADAEVRKTNMANNSGFAPGDKVKHIKFGEGVIKEVNVEDGRTIFSIDFEKSGTRNMDAAYVRLTKL